MGVISAHHLLQHGINGIKLVPVQKFHLLLNLHLQGFQPGNMNPCRSVFQLLQPSRIKRRSFPGLNILIHVPPKFFKLSGGQHFPGIGQTDPIVGSKAPIPRFNFFLNGQLRFLIHLFNFLNSLFRLIESGIFQHGEPAPPII